MSLLRKRYAPHHPRATFGALAAAMTVITLSALVLLPAALETVTNTLN